MLKSPYVSMASPHHFDLARFGDALRIVQDNLDYKNFYAYNPSFDKR